MTTHGTGKTDRNESRNELRPRGHGGTVAASQDADGEGVDLIVAGGKMPCFQSHNEDVTGNQRADASLHDALQCALDQHEFFVVYQPVVDVASYRVVSYEALVRWQHPTRGLVMPAEFIEAAERTGIILRITDYVLDEVCRMLGAAGEPISTIPVSVNLSAVCLAAGGVPGSIRGVLKRFDVPPEKLILEMTETAAIEDSDQVIDQLNELRAMNVRIVVDDFGAGYSSLVNLWRYPVDGLKVDRSLLQDVPYDNRACLAVASMIEMAHKLGLSIVIEGVEDNRQLDWIRQFPDVLGQGYLFGMPAVMAEQARFRNAT
ncbi:EAL domain-containing protein [Burkholderia sp. 4701]|nr:EAL domain-containing protein [Burkholderia sp. 4701]MXN87180.1 EAL domain-containing protein [Burkholderia sp. 4812]